MAKNTKVKTKFVCDSCGAESARWLGRCPVCGEWNTMKEITVDVSSSGGPSFSEELKQGKLQKLSEIELNSEMRMVLHMPEVDRSLGGGIVPGAVILWGGEPGIGKSTLVMQICRAVAQSGQSVMYCSGEESELQIKMRADRLHMSGENCFVTSGGVLPQIIGEAKTMKPALLVIDSIQTMYMPDAGFQAGSPGQIRECTAELVRFAKEYNVAVLIIGHVNKEGNLAGPRILEHMVDVVLYLEGDRSYQFRILRTVKNRFGSTSESGLFMMGETGLQEIEDPSRFLLKERNIQSAGNIVFACMEGLRPILAEIQALTVHSVLAIPRRITVGYDYNRMIVLLAVLEKKAGLSLLHEDVYINVTGGFRIQETAADLAASLAVASARQDYSIPADTMAMGEVALTGEILSVSHIELRLKEALKMKFRRFIFPHNNRREAEAFLKKADISSNLVELYFVTSIKEALTLLQKWK